MLIGRTEEDYIFTEEDYNTFKEEYWKSIHPDIMNRRHKIQQKLHKLNLNLLPKLHQRKIDVELHPSYNKNSRLEFSWDRPTLYNHGQVDWIGTRYGRKTDIEDLGYSKDSFSKDESDINKIGFQKFTVFQVSIMQYGVHVGMFHAVPRDSIDRYLMRQFIYDEKWANGLVDLMKNLEGHNLVWSISPKNNGESDDCEHNFYFDFQKPEDFIQFYKDYDTEGSYSSLMIRFSKWDSKLLKENFENTCLETFELLYPIYDYIKWKRKGV